MKIAFFDAHHFERDVFCEHNQKFNFDFTFLDTNLNVKTAGLAQGYPCVCAFVNDELNADVLNELAKNGTKLIALRSAGYNHVDLTAAAKLGLKVVRVPEYSPYAIAEHAMALILTLNRKIHKAYNRVREGNFSLEGLVGFDLHNKCVGVLGTGRIGQAFIRILKGFGCHVLAFDKYPNEALAKELGFTYASLPEIYACAEIISLHIPLNKETRHLINEEAISSMKKGVMLINTSRGAIIDTKALIKGLKSGYLGAAGLDVYEEEEHVFFHDLSAQVLTDDDLVRLMTFPNVILTSHQAFLTKEALGNIAETTLENIQAFSEHKELVNQVTAP